MQDTTNKSNMLNAALHYTQLGWKVFPIHWIKNEKCSCGKDECSNQGKHPVTRNGFKDATTDLEIIRRWWKKYPEANIGVATGKESGFFVLDVDLPDGEKSLAELESKHRKIPETVEQITGRGGRHLFFKMPADVEIKNSASKIGPNLDVRGAGGYIVVAPSRHVSGKLYAWRPGHEPQEIEMAEAPRWLIDLVKSKPNPPKRELPQSVSVSPTAETTPYGHAALEGEIEALAGVPEGQRNDALNRSAFKIGQLIASGEISLSQAENTLKTVGEQMGLMSTEVHVTVQSGIQKGMEHPRAPEETSGSVTVVDRSEPPRPLVREIPPGGEYPVEALGPLLGDTVRAIVDIVQVPPALAAGSVLAVTSLAEQCFANVVLPIGDGLPKPLSLYMLTIAHSSDRKSTADNYALQAVKEFEAELAESNRAKFQIYLNDKAAYDRARDLVIKNMKKNQIPTKEVITSKSAELSALGDEPPAPLLPTLIVQEPTIEGLEKLFRDGRPSLGLFSTEGAQMVTGYGMRDERKLTTAGGLSLLWDGEALQRTRSGDGNYRLPGKRLTLHLMVQPEVAMQLLSDTALTDQGLISRFLVAYPASLAGTRLFREADPKSLAVIDIFREKILVELRKELPLVAGSRNELNPRRLQFSSSAKSIWIPYYNEMERAIGPGGKFEQIKAFAGKLAEHAARLAGIITLAENFRAMEISGQAMEWACQLARFYGEEALRLFQVGQTAPELQKAKKLLEWLHKRPEPLICLPDIYQRGLNIIRDKATALQLVRILEDHGWLVRVPEGAEIGGQYRRDVWRIIRE